MLVEMQRFDRVVRLDPVRRRELTKPRTRVRLLARITPLPIRRRDQIIMDLRGHDVVGDSHGDRGSVVGGESGCVKCDGI